MRLLPDDVVHITTHENVVSELINADIPVTIYEYFSESLLNSRGYNPLWVKDTKGYVTIYLCDEGNQVKIVVSLGREDSIE